MNTYIKRLALLAAVILIGAAGAGCKVKRVYHERQAEKYFAAGDLDRAA